MELHRIIVTTVYGLLLDAGVGTPGYVRQHVWTAWQQGIDGRDGGGNLWRVTPNAIRSIELYETTLQ